LSLYEFAASPRDQKDLVLILLYKHFPGFEAQCFVPANCEELRRLVSSLVSFTDTALIGRTIIEVKPNAHWMFGTTFTAKYVDFVLRHEKLPPFHHSESSKQIIGANLLLFDPSLEAHYANALIEVSLV
jgi:hypothetical protein